MPFFQNPPDDAKLDRKQRWEAVLSEQIKNWPVPYKQKFDSVNHHLEVKALYVFTMARRLVRATFEIGGNDVENWKSVYVETYILLFPMIELIGKAVYPSQTHGSNGRLAAGLYWLNDPSTLPSFSNNSYEPRQDETRLNSLEIKCANKPTIRDLVRIRNYLLHGIAGQTNESWAISYEHPYALAVKAESAMREYWQRLKDPSPKDWVTRLAQADIQPFPILGSGDYEQCLVDFDILDYLQNPAESHFAKNRG